MSARADTHCPYCALQCAITVSGTGEVEPRDFPTNRGSLCQKGWTAGELLRTSDRLVEPMVRIDGELRATTWKNALDTLALRLRRLRADHGAGAVAVFGGGGLTNEKAYQLGKFARLALGTKHIDYNGRFCMSSAAAAGNRAFGVDRGLPFPLSDVRETQALLLVGSNVAETMPPLVQHLGGVRRRGGRIVVDPRESATAKLDGDGGGLHLQPVPGTDLVLLMGLLHLVITANGVDEDYVRERTTGFDDVVRSVSQWWPDRVARETGVAEALLRQAAQMLIDASPECGGDGAMVLTGRGAEQHHDGTDTVTAAINLALALGLPGRPRSGYGCLTGQGNGQGGREHGQKSDQLPGYRMISDPAARAHVAEVWGVDPDSLPGPGVPAVELLDKLGGEVKALLVHGSNIAVSAPDASAVIERLKSLELLVVCDLVPSETAMMADIVLPVTQWAEESGTMTSLEGRVLRRRQALAAPAGVRDELWILAELADRLDAPGMWPVESGAVFDELRRASAGGKADYSGVSHARLDQGEELYWPCPEGTSGTARMFVERFAHHDGRARCVAVRAGAQADPPRADAPIHLITGRVLAHYQSGAQTRRVEQLTKASGSVFVEIHPHLARRLDIEEGDQVWVTSPRGRAVAPARIVTSIRPDTVFMPFHWPGESSVNRVTLDVTDPISGMPEFKVCAVSLERAPHQHQEVS